MLLFCLASIVMGLVPMTVYALILWWVDHFEREPWWLVGGAFLWGAIPAVMAAAVMQVVANVVFFGHLALGDQAGPQAYFMAVFMAPVTEEFFKALPLLAIFLLRRHELDSYFDGLVYGAMVGFGFAAVENIGYFLAFGRESAAHLVVLIALRAFAFGPAHALFTGLTGLGFAAARFQRNLLLKVVLPLAGLAAGMLLHAFHNLLATLGGAWPLAVLVAEWFGVFWVVVLAVVSLLQQRRIIDHQMREEVAAGVLTESQARMALAPGRLAIHAFLPFLEWFGRSVGTRKLTTLCAELAFRKHQAQRLGHEAGAAERIAQLRQALHHHSLAMRNA